MKAATPAGPQTLLEAVAYFADPDAALAYFVNIRWPDGVRCPTCGCDRVHFLRNQQRFQCAAKHPKRQFSAKVGTVFEDSPLPLGKWLVALWLEVNAKNSISSWEVHRALGITQKSAWFMQQRIRLAMQTGTFEKMSGTVEADETYIGGKAEFMHADRRKRKVTGTGAFGSGKACVMGLLERHGPDGSCSKVRTKVLPDTRRKTVHPVVRDNVAPGSHLYTDSLASYSGLGADYVHQFIDHAETYAAGVVHTNGLENFWSLFKRCIKCTHVSVEPFHLFRYLDAEAFRFNNRKTDDGARFVAVAKGVTGKRLTYKSLIGADMTVGDS